MKMSVQSTITLPIPPRPPLPFCLRSFLPSTLVVVDTQATNHALAVAKGPCVILYPRATSPRKHASTPSTPPSPHTAFDVASSATNATTRDAQTPRKDPPSNDAQMLLPDRTPGVEVEWYAHEHNITAMSGAPFPGPVSRTFPVSSVPEFPASSIGSNKSDERVPSTASASIAGGNGDVGNGRGAARKRSRRGGETGVSPGARTRTALLYTCSIDGRCKEWEVRMRDVKEGRGSSAASVVGGGKEILEQGLEARGKRGVVR